MDLQVIAIIITITAVVIPPVTDSTTSSFMLFQLFSIGMRKELISFVCPELFLTDQPVMAPCKSENIMTDCLISCKTNCKFTSLRRSSQIQSISFCMLLHSLYPPLTISNSHNIFNEVWIPYLFICYHTSELSSLVLFTDR